MKTPPFLRTDAGKALSLAAGVGLAGGVLWWLIGDAKASASPPSPSPAPLPSSPGEVPDVSTFPFYEGNAGLAAISEIGKFAGLPTPWIQWLQVVAFRESRGFSRVALCEPRYLPRGAQLSSRADKYGAAESSAARTALKRLQGYGQLTCGWPDDAYLFGGGWWGELSPYAAVAWNGTPFECVRHPWYQLHPADQFCSALAHARRLTLSPAWISDSTAARLRAGWRRSSDIGDQSAIQEIAADFAADAQALGLGPGWIFGGLPALPDFDPYDLHSRLMARFW